MKIAIACDHAGFILKDIVVEHLKNKGHDVVDCGTNSKDSVDYPDYAKIAAEKISTGVVERGIFICGSGIGISIAANRFKKVRCALCHDTYSAKMCRLHNDANAIALGANFTAAPLALEIINEWLDTSFEGGRHVCRIDKLDFD